MMVEAGWRRSGMARGAEESRGINCLSRLTPTLALKSNVACQCRSCLARYKALTCF